MQKHELQLAIEHANSRGRKAVILFITAGFPDKERFWDELGKLDRAGADIIEIGIPFSDPVADGPFIEDASRQAIERGVTLAWIINGLLERAGNYTAKLVFMGYCNPFVQYGLDKLAADARKAGVSGFVVPDLQFDEAEPFRKAFEAEGLALVTLVSPNTPLERMKQYAQTAQGFVYITAVLGITGGKTDITGAVTDTIRRARKAFDIPLALGFGLQTPGQLDALPADAQPDAAVIGSALLKHIDAGGNSADFLSPWIGNP